MKKERILLVEQSQLILKINSRFPWKDAEGRNNQEQHLMPSLFSAHFEHAGFSIGRTKFLKKKPHKRYVKSIYIIITIHIFENVQ